VENVATTKKLTLKLAKLAYHDAINNCGNKFVCSKMNTENKGVCPISNTRLGISDINLH
jgi:hypothetical protein